MIQDRKPAQEYVVTRHRPGQRLRRAVLVLALALVAGVAGYGAGLVRGGFEFVGDSGAVAPDLLMQKQLQGLQEQYSEAKQQLANLERGKLIDRQALDQARTTIVDLETRVASLQSDLTFYQNIMAPSEVSKGLQVDNFTLVQARQSRSYRFKLVLTQVGNNKSYIKGLVAVNVIGVQEGTKEVIALRDLSEDIEDLGVKFRFRYFQDVEGTLTLPESFKPLEIQVVAQAEGKKSSQAERTFDWDDVLEN